MNEDGDYLDWIIPERKLIDDKPPYIQGDIDAPERIGPKPKKTKRSSSKSKSKKGSSKGEKSSSKKDKTPKKQSSEKALKKQKSQTKLKEPPSMSSAPTLKKQKSQTKLKEPPSMSSAPTLTKQKSQTKLSDTKKDKPQKKDKVPKEGKTQKKDKPPKEGKPQKKDKLPKDQRPPKEGKLPKKDKPLKEGKSSKEGKPQKKEKIPKEDTPQAGTSSEKKGKTPRKVSPKEEKLRQKQEADQKALADNPADERLQKNWAESSRNMEEYQKKQQLKKSVKKELKRQTAKQAAAQTSSPEQFQQVQQQAQQSTQSAQQVANERMNQMAEATMQQPLVVQGSATPPPPTVLVFGNNPTPPVSQSSVPLFVQTAGLNQPAPIVTTTNTPAALLTGGVSDLNDPTALLQTIGWAPATTLDAAAQQLPLTDIQELYAIKQQYKQALQDTNNNEQDPRVKQLANKFLNKLGSMRRSLGTGGDIRTIIDASGLYHNDPARAEAVAAALSNPGMESTRAKIIYAYKKARLNPIGDPDLKRVIENAAKKIGARRVKCHHHAKAVEHLSLWQECMRPIRITHAPYNLIDEYEHYQELMAKIRRKAPYNYLNINDIPHVDDVFETIYRIFKVVSFLAPEGCPFPPKLHRHLRILTEIELLTFINSDPMIVNLLRNERAVFYNYLRDVKGDTIADAWREGGPFASLLLERLRQDADPAILEKCMSSPSTHDVFGVYLTINRVIDPTHRINVLLRPNGPAHLAPRKPTQIKELKNNVDRYRDEVLLDPQQVIQFIRLVKKFYPIAAKPIYTFDHAPHYKIQFMNGMAIAKDDRRDPEWKKLWALFDSFISSFHF